MKPEEITIDMKAKLAVDRETAETCLKLVEIYVNQTGRNVIAFSGENRTTRFEFESGTVV